MYPFEDLWNLLGAMVGCAAALVARKLLSTFGDLTGLQVEPGRNHPWPSMAFRSWIFSMVFHGKIVF